MIYKMKFSPEKFENDINCDYSTSNAKEYIDAYSQIVEFDTTLGLYAKWSVSHEEQIHKDWCNYLVKPRRLDKYNLTRKLVL